MGEPGHLIVAAAVCAVAIVLVCGLVNMSRGGCPHRSRRLMLWRIVLQLIAVAALLAVVLAGSK